MRTPAYAFAIAIAAVVVMAYPTGVDARPAAARGDGVWAANVKLQPPTLEQIAYRYWGERLDAACPGGSLHFRVVRTLDGAGGSWGDCRPAIKKAGGPEMCDTALHEAGHEIGLPDRPGEGGLMDNTRMIIKQRGLIRTKRGRWVKRTSWTGIRKICQPRAIR